MTNCYVIQKLPNRLDIKYTVQPKPDDVPVALSILINDVAAEKVAEHTLSTAWYLKLWLKN